MEQINVSKKVTATILSMSLLTVMAGAAIAPALGIIKAHFSEANGLLVQLTIASIKGGRNSATTVMPLLSAALYLGQFLSPLIVMPLSRLLFGTDLTAPYKVGILLCLAFLVQVWTTRHFQSLPPEK